MRGDDVVGFVEDEVWAGVRGGTGVDGVHGSFGLLRADVESLASEGEVDTSVVGPVYLGRVAEGYVVAGGEDGVERVSGDVGGGVHQLLETEVGEVVEQGGGVGVVVLLQVKVEVTEEGVVRRGKGVRGDEVSNGFAEEGVWSRGSVDESSSEGGPGVGVDLKVHVFGGEGGVFGGGGDVDGVLESDGDSSTDLVGAVSPGDLVAVGDGYGNVGGRGGVHPGLSDEGDVRCGGVQEVP
ncbi:hypothetical protein NDU88_002913 [Pleurodeles waltl]|uniref:Uncharacterized protein n=1 Tax=Pleurodeles waltl TaxID=8319 RepID=A0AAV7SET8_PLEWA|nr:hypothetical protein NDU88_002913 [Pleurodeles waltl]